MISLAQALRHGSDPLLVADQVEALERAVLALILASPQLHSALATSTVAVHGKGGGTFLDSDALTALRGVARASGLL